MIFSFPLNKEGRVFMDPQSVQDAELAKAILTGHHALIQGSLFQANEYASKPRGAEVRVARKLRGGYKSLVQFGQFRFIR
jgi:hypothetical protein